MYTFIKQSHRAKVDFCKRGLAYIYELCVMPAETFYLLVENTQKVTGKKWY